jgi:hypothetical protein
LKEGKRLNERLKEDNATDLHGIHAQDGPVDEDRAAGKAGVR